MDIAPCNKMTKENKNTGLDAHIMLPKSATFIIM